MKNLFRQEPALIVGAIADMLALLAAFGFKLLTPEQAGAVIAFVSSATILTHSLVYSPATAEQIKEQRDILAETVVTADQTGTVPYQGTKTAKKVLGQAVDLVVPPGLMAEALKWGLSQNFVLAAGVELTKQAIAAAKEASKRPATYDESKDVIRDLGKEL
jgi:hypothetical protein